jgi:hypothetical protein
LIDVSEAGQNDHASSMNATGHRFLRFPAGERVEKEECPHQVREYTTWSVHTLSENYHFTLTT